MREQFPWFLDPTEDELERLWEEATFAFDANVLLNLYRVDRETTEDYFKIFRALGDRIFLTHEAANQFFLRRQGVIRTEQNSFTEAKQRVQNWVERRTGFDNLKQQLSGGDIGDIIEDEIKDEIENVFDSSEDYEQAIEAVKDALIKRIGDLEERFEPTGTTRANAEEDRILGELMEIFEGKTGEPLDESMEDLKDEALERYEKEKPPGYEDYQGKEELSRGECEDFIIWEQLMEFAERDDEDVVFITDDDKPDWWEVDNDHNTVRPRHQLLREFSRETGQSFWMLSVEAMIDGASEILELDISEKSAEQTIKISAQQTVGVEATVGLNKDDIDIGRELRSLSKEIERKVESVVEIRALTAGATGAARAKLSKEEDDIISKVMRAQEISNELRSPHTEDTVREHIQKLSRATAVENEESAMTYASDLENFLEMVADTLRKETYKRSSN